MRTFYAFLFALCVAFSGCTNSLKMIKASDFPVPETPSEWLTQLDLIAINAINVKRVSCLFKKSEKEKTACGMKALKLDKVRLSIYEAAAILVPLYEDAVSSGDKMSEKEYKTALIHLAKRLPDEFREIRFLVVRLLSE